MDIKVELEEPDLDMTLDEQLDVKKSELADFKRSLRLRGFVDADEAEEDDVRCAVRAAIKGKLPFDAPTPEQNGISELLNVKVDHEEMFDIDSEIFKDEDAESDEEREKDKNMDFVEAAVRNGLLTKPTTTIKQEIAEHETEGLKDILVALTMVSTGHKLLASGADKVRDIIAQMPSLGKLELLLGAVKNTDPALLAIAKAESKIPVTDGVCLPKTFKPKKVNSSFFCRICEAKFGSWTGCDSHIRSIHSHLKYGPCRHCNKFSTPNYDSFRSHERWCSTQ